MKKLLLLGALLVVPCFCARAQTALYGTVSASDFHVANVGWQYGSTFGIYSDPWGVPFVKAGMDLRGSVLGSGNAQAVSGLVGPRVQLHPHVLPLMPYVEALVGGAHVTVGQGAAYTAKTGLEYQFAAGLDTTVLPRLDWRLEYAWGSVENLNTTFQPATLSTGLVLRLP